MLRGRRHAARDARRASAPASATPGRRSPSKLLTDELAAGALLVAVAWLATAAASEGLALLSEMSGSAPARASAGCGYAWTAIASKLLTDELAAGALLVAARLAGDARSASEGLALLSEMSALQRRPATHVAPVMFAVQVLVPVILAPLIFGESWGRRRSAAPPWSPSWRSRSPAPSLLAGSKAVGAVIETAHASD